MKKLIVIKIIMKIIILFLLKINFYFYFIKNKIIMVNR